MPREKLEELLDRLAEETRDPSSERAESALRVALGHRSSYLVAQAAASIRDHRLPGFAKELDAALERFFEQGVKRDPGCRAKLAIVEAMDATDSPAHAPFERAARHVQPEPVWGSTEDTAPALRSRAVLALARGGYPDLLLLAGELLADPVPGVRLNALNAIAAHGDRAGAALAQLKVRLGDEDPLVTAAAMAALLALAPDVALPTLTTYVEGEDEMLRELALIALGESKRAEALDVLLTRLEGSVRTADRATVFTALALHRSEPALRVLLVWAGAHPSDARAALEALSVRRFEVDVVARIEEAAQPNAPLFEELFGD